MSFQYFLVNIMDLENLLSNVTISPMLTSPNNLNEIIWSAGFYAAFVFRVVRPGRVSTKQ